MFKKIKFFIFFFIFISATTSNVQANVNGDIESIGFEIEAENKDIKLLDSDPLPALYSEADWIGVADTNIFSFSGGTNFGNLFDNNLTSYISWNRNWILNVKFEKPIALKNMKYVFSNKSIASGNTGIFEYEFYNGESLVLSNVYQPLNTQGTKRIVNQTVDKVVTSVKFKINKASLNFESKLYEMEFYTEESITYESVKEVTALSELNQIEINYKNSDSIYLDGNVIKINGVVDYEGTKKNSHIFSDLEEGTMYKIEIGSVYFDGVTVWTEVEVRTKTTKPDKPKDVTDFDVKFINDQIELTFKKPLDADYLLIYKNGQLIENKYLMNSYIDKDYELGKNYTYKIVAVNDGGKSSGVSKTIEIPTKEITNLRAKTTDKDVELFWDLPIYNDFELVSIYRKEDSGMLPKFKALFSSDNDYDHIFMTNGTYFKDMTVAPDKGYEYKLTTLSKSGEETSGEIIKTKTKQVMITGSDLLPVTPDSEKSDYKLTWEKPTTGQIKILIDNKEYKTIDAAALSYTIPAADVVLNGLGVPSIKIVPVEVGTGREVGPVIIPGETGFEVDIPFDADNLLTAAITLLSFVGAFLLLGLAFRVVPKLIRIIRQAFDDGRSKTS